MNGRRTHVHPVGELRDAPLLGEKLATGLAPCDDERYLRCI